MKLDRNTVDGASGKYALIKMRRIREMVARKDIGPSVIKLKAALRVLTSLDVMDDSAPETEGEFFVIRLKDKYAKTALLAYALAARNDDPEYADEIEGLASRSGMDSPWCKRPD